MKKENGKGKGKERGILERKMRTDGKKEGRKNCGLGSVRIGKVVRLRPRRGARGEGGGGRWGC